MRKKGILLILLCGTIVLASCGNVSGYGEDGSWTDFPWQIAEMAERLKELAGVFIKEEKQNEDKQNEETKNEDPLASLAQSVMTVEEGEIHMENEAEGQAQVTVELPDYQTLFLTALQTNDPDSFLKNALESGDFTYKKVETEALVTIKNGKQVVHSEEAAKDVLEKELVEVIASMIEEE